MSVRGAHGCAFHIAEYPTLRYTLFLKFYRQYSHQSREIGLKNKNAWKLCSAQSTFLPKILQFDCILRQIDRQTKGNYTWQEKD